MVVYLWWTLLAIVVMSVNGQDQGTLGTDDLSQVYPSYLGQEDPDIVYPSPSPEGSEPDRSYINWNNTVDYILDLATSNGQDEVPLPDITETFNRRVGILKLKGNFTASRGLLKGLSSVRRSGDVTVTKRGTAFSMTCAVRLKDVRITYEHYRVKLFRRGPSLSGSIEGEIGSNSVEVNVTIDVTNTACTTTLNCVKVTEVSGLKVRVKGLGAPFDFLLSMISTWLMDMFHGDLVRNLEKGLIKEMKRGMTRTHCEKYASYFIFVDPK